MIAERDAAAGHDSPLPAPMAKSRRGFSFGVCRGHGVAMEARGLCGGLAHGLDAAADIETGHRVFVKQGCGYLHGLGFAQITL